MARAGRIDPLDLLSRREDPARLAKFFQNFDEGIHAAFLDSSRRVPADRADRPAVYARGNYRRWQLDQAFRKAALKAGLTLVTGSNSQSSWTYPIIRTGAFSLTLGMVDKSLARGPRRLRCRGKYMQQHAARNGVMSPQARLEFDRRGVTSVIPNGAIGAVIVVESSLHQPDRPRYVGFWIPHPSLSKAYFRIKLDDLVEYLVGRAATAPRKVSQLERKKPVRKLVRKLPRRKSDGES